MSHYLYLEIEGIQRFIFASPKLKDIRGGSALLDMFNRMEMQTSAPPNARPVFLGGGHCLLKGVSSDEAEELARNLARRLRRDTHGQANLKWGIAPTTSTFASDWQALQADMGQRELTEQVTPIPSLPPFVALCGACGLAPAESLVDVFERHPQPLCHACNLRRERAKGIRELRPGSIWRRLQQHMPAYARNDAGFRDVIPTGEFQELSDDGTGSQYLAYVYCDGNGVGHLLAQLQSEEEYAALSRLIDEALHEAVAYALLQHCAPEQERGEERFGAEVLLLGGDDLIVVLRADRASEFTCSVMEEFYSITSDALRKDSVLKVLCSRYEMETKEVCELSLSAGLVYAQSDTPIVMLQEAAKSLLVSAKRRYYLDRARIRRQLPLVPRIPAEERICLAAVGWGEANPKRPSHGYIDFQELSASQVEIEREYAVTCRPYRLEEFEILVDRIRALRAERVPRGRLYTLMEACHGSKREAFTAARLIVGRTRGKKPSSALRAALRPPCIEDRPGLVPPFTLRDDIEFAAPSALPLELYSAQHRWSPITEVLELLDHVGTVSRDLEETQGDQI